jgi:hypothetical protein
LKNAALCYIGPKETNHGLLQDAEEGSEACAEKEEVGA